MAATALCSPQPQALVPGAWRGSAKPGCLQGWPSLQGTPAPSPHGLHPESPEPVGQQERTPLCGEGLSHPLALPGLHEHVDTWVHTRGRSGGQRQAGRQHRNLAVVSHLARIRTKTCLGSEAPILTQFPGGVPDRSPALLSLSLLLGEQDFTVSFPPAPVSLGNGLVLRRAGL